jgi:hypothetical protein
MARHVLDIRQHQFLVLLFVIEAKLEERPQLGAPVRSVHEPRHVLVDVRAIAQHLRERGARQQPSLRSRMSWPDCLVVRVEQVFETLVKHRVGRQVCPKQELLEEPARVGQVPLGRTDVRHALHRTIFRRQRRDDPQRRAAYARIPGRRIGGR